MNKKTSRRRLLKVLAAVVSAIGLGKVLGPLVPRGIAQELDKYIYLPIILKEATPTSTPAPTATPTATPTPIPGSGPKVVHVHNPAATHWNGETDYWNHVDQNVVNTMVDQGVMTLTGTSTVADAWRALIPAYQPGQKIAIKVNFNNSSGCSDADGQIDALIQPVNAVVRGLKQIGVAETDIRVYDAIRPIPNRFVNGCQYSNVQFFDSGCRNVAGWGPYVTFSPPPGVPTPSPRQVTNALANAAYLINMPIMKGHTGPGVTLSFKNHLGTISDPDLHDYIYLGGSLYRTDYNPLVDLYQDPCIFGKTILTIGDGLFACRPQEDLPPSVWTTFKGKLPNSLFFATDPVAIDCVMCDFLNAESPLAAESDRYLRLASNAGLGVFERRNPPGGYSQIVYWKIEL
jgi:hypothetical protein